MVRNGVALKLLLSFGLALRFRHHVHGAPFDYAGLALGSAASWLGIPGPGEPLLIAAGVLAASHKLDIVSVVAVAWASATAGGIAGWLIGMKAGRAVLITRGPLRSMRRAALARGDEVFARHPVIAILLTPAWIAGIHRVGGTIYLTVNAVSAMVWAAGIGLAAYYIGPTVIDFVGDLGWVTGGGLVVLVVATVGAQIVRRRKRRAGLR